MAAKPKAKPKAKAKAKPKANLMAMSSPMMDKQWQAESDARTLLDAEKIKADKARLGAAKSHAEKQAALFSKIGKA